MSECTHMAHVVTVLDTFQRFDRPRSFLCHGVGTLVLDRREQWCLGYKLLCFRSNLAVRDTLFLTREDAASLLADIEAVVGRLRPALGHVRKAAAG